MKTILQIRTSVMIQAAGAAMCLAMLCASSPAAAQAFTTSNSSNCSACHQKQSTNSPQALISKHTATGLDCFACHDKTDLETKHPDKTKVPGRLIRKRRFPNELCLRCHGDYKQLAEKTKDSKAFTTLDGRIINPHDVSATVKADGHDRTECYNCHKVHETTRPIDYCYGCHHSRQLNSCKECHSKGK